MGLLPRSSLIPCLGWGCFPPAIDDQHWDFLGGHMENQHPTGEVVGKDEGGFENPRLQTLDPGLWTICPLHVQYSPLFATKEPPCPKFAFS